MLQASVVMTVGVGGTGVTDGSSVAVGDRGVLVGVAAVAEAVDMAVGVASGESSSESVANAIAAPARMTMTRSPASSSGGFVRSTTLCKLQRF